MAPALPFLPAIISGVSAVGGLIQGNKQAGINQQYINMQDQQMSKVNDLANQMVNRVTRAEYDSNANRDVTAALQDVFSVMSARGMGRSTAGLTAAAGASGQIRSQYGQKYLSDRLSSLQTAGSMIGSTASTGRLGFDTNPYAGFQAGLTGLSTAAAKYSVDGWPTLGGNAPAQNAVGGTPGFGVSYNPPAQPLMQPPPRYQLNY